MTQMQFPAKESLLLGHTSEETAYVVDDYPYSFTLRCKIRYWVETKKGKGQRFVSQTLNPKTNRWNNPKASTYYTAVFMYLNDEGHVKFKAIAPYDEEKFPAQMDFLVNVVGLEHVPKEAQDLIRDWYAANIQINHVYRKDRYETDEAKEAFKNWTKATTKHILSAPFAEIHKHEPAPAYDAQVV